MVLAVGAFTHLARVRGKKEYQVTPTETHLDHKLDVMARKIGQYAQLVMVASILTSLVFQFLYILYSDATLLSNETLLKVCQIAIVAVVILIVAIPEGLGLSVSLAMSFSLNKLKQ